MQRLRLAGEQKPNPGCWDIEGEEEKNDQIQLIKHSNQSGAERSFHFTWLYVMSPGSLFFTQIWRHSANIFESNQAYQLVKTFSMTIVN